MRQWPNDPTVAHLIFVDHQRVPTADAVDAALAHATRRDARAIRTSALFPDAADVLMRCGFAPLDRLALLRIDLEETIGSFPELTFRPRPLHGWSFGAAAAVDQASFGPLWGNDAASLRDTRKATPHHRARVIRIDGELAGFALSGAAAANGYVQRVAVAPAFRRRGAGLDLVTDALRWMHGSGRSVALVNTAVDNEAALALYHGLGFRTLSDTLTIAERRLSG
jgi:ribosomal protein S18 acetylase RimI-like enzyme